MVMLRTAPLLVVCLLQSTRSVSEPVQSPLEGRGLNVPAQFFEVTASTLYDAGLQHGRLARHQINGWFQSNEMQTLFNFISKEGRARFERLKADNSLAFPQYVEEMQGIAEGAEVDMDKIWAANLINELEITIPHEDHCSNVFSFNGKHLAMGHNEDWNLPVMPYWYYMKYTAASGADWGSCAGLVYPGTLVGWAPTWNAHGVYMDQNTLFPLRVLSHGGLGQVFIQRDAVCGAAGRQGLDAVVAAVTGATWSEGASVNVVDMNEQRMVNIEIHENRYDVFEVTNAVGNYSHVNLYKRLSPGGGQKNDTSSYHRQERLDQLPAPRSFMDVARILTDRQDGHNAVGENFFPIQDLRRTITTLVLDGATGYLHEWHYNTSASSGHSPTRSWDLLNFFVDGPEMLTLHV